MDSSTGAAQLPDSSLGLIDAELVEHERWATADARVGGASSEARAAFIATQVGGGAVEGFGTGFVMGLVTTIGVQAAEKGLEQVAGVAIPGVGAVIGGVMSAYALVSGWDKNAAAVGKMGQGRSGYEEAANDIEGVCAMLDIASNLVGVMAGVVGAVAVASAAAALLTLGALSPLAVTAGSIAAAIGVAGMVLGLVKMALQPLVLLFRSLHAFTSQADPREIEAQGNVLEEGGKEMGGALGGMAGAAVAGIGRTEREEAKGGRGEEVPPASSAPDGEPLVVEAEPPPGQRSADLDDGALTTPGSPREPLTADAPPPGPTHDAPETSAGADDVWPEEYNVPSASEPPIEVQLSKERADAMLRLAESGDARGFHTDAELYDLHQDAAGRRRPGPMRGPRQEFNKLRDRMDLPPDFQGPIHHEQYPMREFGGRALDPDNLYATRTGSSAHKDFHQAFGAEGAPYRRMAPGFDEPGIQYMFDFANSPHTAGPVTSAASPSASSPTVQLTAPSPVPAAAPPALPASAPRTSANGAVPPLTTALLPSQSGVTASGPLQATRTGQLSGGMSASSGLVVSAVNPQYEPPPGTRAEIDRLGHDIQRLQAARAQALARQARAEQVQGMAATQAPQVQRAQQQTDDAITAARAHQAQVQMRESAQQQSLQQHETVAGKVHEAGAQLSGIGTLEVLLAGWSGFTGLVLDWSAVLPDSAVRAFQEMNKDSTDFMRKLVGIKTSVACQQAQGPSRGAAVEQAGTRIASATQRAGGAEQQFTGYQRQATQLSEANGRSMAVAARERTRAAGNAARADAATAATEQRRLSLAQDMEAWAVQHRQARQGAVTATVGRLEARGLLVTRRPEV